MLLMRHRTYTLRLPLFYEAGSTGTPMMLPAFPCTPRLDPSSGSCSMGISIPDLQITLSADLQ